PSALLILYTTLFRSFQDVKFITAEEDPSNPPVRPDGKFAPVSVPGPPVSSGAAKQQRFDWDSAAQLNPKYTFEAFVAGSGNQFEIGRAHVELQSPDH